jgi:transposase
MGKPHPVELRQRVVDHVAEGNTHRSTAERFRVSVKFVNDMVKLKAATGGLAPKPQGNGGGHGKLAALKDWIARRIGEKRDLTAAALAAEIATTHGVTVRRGSVWSLLRGLGLTHKKRPARRRAEAARGGPGAPSLDRQAPALHAQPADADRFH